MTFSESDRSLTTSPPTCWNRWGWMLIIALPILGAAVGVTLYGRATNWYFLLPGLPPIEKFREEPERMHALADALRLPRPPAVRAWPMEEVMPVYEAYGRLRRDPTDADAAGNLGRVLEAHGDISGAIQAYRRAVEIQPGRQPWADHLARALEPAGQADQVRAVHRKRERDEVSEEP